MRSITVKEINKELKTINLTTQQQWLLIDIIKKNNEEIGFINFRGLLSDLKNEKGLQELYDRLSGQIEYTGFEDFAGF